MSKRSGSVFTFTHDRPTELVCAYALIDRAKTFLKKQKNKYGLEPHLFIVGTMELMLADRWWHDNIVGYRMTFNQVSRYALQYWEKKKLDREINEARKKTFIDYTILSPQWN
jgi:hypothetical protein